MKIIRFFTDFCDSRHAMNVYLRIDKLSESTRYGTDYIFTADDNYTHAIIINTVMPSLRIPREHAIGLAAEPPYFLRVSPTFIKYAQNHLSKYYIGDATGLSAPFLEKYSYQPWHRHDIITSLPPSLPPLKTKCMSIMVSHKKDAPGHKYRHEIVRRILSGTLPIDIYGNGCGEYSHDHRVKGKFNEFEPYEEYAFHICIENFSLPEYFSEKIIQALVCYTTPVYYGCKHINQYFPNSTITLTGQIEEDMKLLENIVTNPSFYQKTIDVSHVKKTISIENIIDQFDS